MAENEKAEPVGIEDILPVRSRVSWGAILAGAVVAIATYMLLGLLGGAIGVTVADDVQDDTLSAGAALWALISLIVAMFLAGWITCQCAVGETKREAAVHGIITWGVVLALSVWMVSAGIGAGLSAMTGLAQAGGANNVDWEAAAREAGVTQETINQWRQSVQNDPAAANQAAPEPQNREQLRDAAASMTWWTLAGAILSLAAAVVGALVGAGPNFALFRETSGATYVVREGRFRTAQ